MIRLLENQPFRAWKTWDIPGTTLTLSGYSRANDKTFFDIPQLRCCIDAGLCEGRQPERVFLTHTHADHSKDIDFLASRAGGVDIYAPVPAIDYLATSIRASRELNFMAPFDPSLAGELRLHGVRRGDVIAFGNHTARVFDCVHKIPCVGYAFSETKRRLKPAFHGQPGAVLAQRRKDGIAIDEEVAQPLFAFVGDTHPRVFAETPWLFDYPTIITECTYLDDRELERADRVGHTVWSQLRPTITAHPEITFVLIHFSLRHSDREVIEFFEREQLPNVVVWAA